MFGISACLAESFRPSEALLADQRKKSSTGRSAIAISRDRPGAKINFSGTLQSAESINGPWHDVSGASSPFVPDLARNSMFYRTRETDSIFSSPALLEWTLTGPFQTHFDLAFAGIPDGIIPPMGFIAPRVRRARIEYRDTTASDGVMAAGWRVDRDALILDHIEVVAERLSGRALDEEEIAALTDAKFDEQLIANLQLFHALLGNWDYSLSMDGRGLWNTEVIEFESGKRIPVAGDFDLSSWVTANVRVSAPRNYRIELEDIDRQALYEIEIDPKNGSFIHAAWQSVTTALTPQLGLPGTRQDRAGRFLRSV